MDPDQDMGPAVVNLANSKEREWITFLGFQLLETKPDLIHLILLLLFFFS